MNYDNYSAFTCLACEYTFESEQALIRHEVEHHHRVVLGRKLRNKRQSEEPTQAEIDATLASIADAAKPNI